VASDTASDDWVTWTCAHAPARPRPSSPAGLHPSNPRPTCFEYKLLSEAGREVRRHFDIAGLDSTINGYADEGWRLTEAFVAANVAKSGKAQIVVILQRARRTIRVRGERAADYSSRWLTMLITFPSGARTKNRRTPHGSAVSGWTIS
jgi:hypothetical protein